MFSSRKTEKYILTCTKYFIPQKIKVNDWVSWEKCGGTDPNAIKIIKNLSLVMAQLSECDIYKNDDQHRIKYYINILYKKQFSLL